MRYAAQVDRTARLRPAAARGQPLQVLFPRADQRFVEVVQIEYDFLTRRMEEAEIIDITLPSMMTLWPIEGDFARSHAITVAAPRRNVNGDPVRAAPVAVGFERHGVAQGAAVGGFL